MSTSAFSFAGDTVAMPLRTDEFFKSRVELTGLRKQAMLARSSQVMPFAQNVRDSMTLTFISVKAVGEAVES